MYRTVLRAIYKVALKEDPVTPTAPVVFPWQIAKETGMSEAQLDPHLKKLRDLKLVKFISADRPWWCLRSRACR